MNLNSYQLIGEGNTAEIYRMDDEKVLKLFRTGFNKDAVKMEYQNSVCVQSVLESVPKVYDMVEVEGRDGIIYEAVSGHDMFQLMLKKAWKMSKITKDFAKYHYYIQRELHESMITVKEKLNYDIAAVDLLSEEEKAILKHYIATLPDGDYLCHFDFHPGNIMMVNDKPVFLDWMTACKGDRCADVARTCILLKYGQLEHAPIWVQKLLALGKNSMCKKYCKEYTKLLGITKKDIDKWEVPIAAARLRESISESEKMVLLDLVKQKLDSCKNINTL